MKFDPIGIIRTGKNVKFDTPHQPKDGIDERNVIELFPGRDFDKAVCDLEGFERIWLIWWFHRNKTWRPKVLPPRGGAKRRGVFATRSPHRPNPIGITCVPLLGVSGLKIFVGNVDLLDGTPILDIKPYLRTADAFPESKMGWLDEVEAELKSPPKYSIELSAIAAKQIKWLEEKWGVDFVTTARTVLERDPSPHRTRRITRSDGGKFRMGCGAWRVYFEVTDARVKIDHVAPGYPMKLLKDKELDFLPDRDAQLAFYSNWS